MTEKAKSLNKQNNELDKQLNAENNPVMTDIVCYLRAANITEYQQEEVRRDLLEMALSAQARGEDFKSVIGEDYKTFCDEVIKSLPPRSLFKRFLSVLDTVFMCTSIMGVLCVIISRPMLDLIYNAITGKAMNFQFPVTVSNLIIYIITFLGAYIVVQVICKTALKPRKKPGSKLKRFIIGGLIGGGVFGVFLLIVYFGKQTLFTVNIFAAIIVILVLYIAHKTLQRFCDV